MRESSGLFNPRRRTLEEVVSRVEHAKMWRVRNYQVNGQTPFISPRAFIENEKLQDTIHLHK